MDGIHDLGGKQGFGPIVFTGAEAQGGYDPFPEGSQPRAWGMAMAAATAKGMVGDLFRFTRECIPPIRYLERPYFEQWLTCYVATMLEKGGLDWTEIETGTATAPWAGDPPVSADRVAAFIAHRDIFERPTAAAPAYKSGDRVRANSTGHAGHTRLPGFARGHAGIVHAHHGAHVLPDSNAHGGGEDPRHLYSVAFRAADLWPERAGSKDRVFIDLWECYLEPA